MPVINLFYDKLSSILKHPLTKQEIIENLPYLGLDLEEQTDEYVKVEFNPNRPDFSSEWGIARALNGLMEFETGLPSYTVKKSNVVMNVDKSVDLIRPFFVGAIVRGVKFDDYSIKQIMAMQDDLDNGIGRRRSKVSTGLHNFDVVEPPFEYKSVPSDYKFTPLGYKTEKSIEQILKEVETGKKYGHILKKFQYYPVILDKNDNVMSFPPIINGDISSVTTDTKNLFIDITSTNLQSANDVLAVLLTTFSDMGGKIESIQVQYTSDKKISPNINSTQLTVDSSLINNRLGMNLSSQDIVKYLKRSRLDAIIDNGSISVIIPRYRSDIIHPIDIVEEVLIGYNVSNVTPTIPKSTNVGKLNSKLIELDSAREILSGLGLIEVMNYSLISRETIVRIKGNEHENHLKVKNPKTGEHEYLRKSIIPSILSTLSKNIHEEYPQRIFEISTVFNRNKENINEIDESNVISVVIAHSNANYTEAKSYLSSFLNQFKEISCNTTPLDQNIFISGRAAKIEYKNNIIGSIGEITPSILEAFSLRVPVSAFELNTDYI